MKMKRRVAQLAAGGGLILAALVASAAPTSAAPVTPNGLCGARNMVNVHAREAMLEAMMEHTNENGDAGMAGAVARTACT
jgi:hypothetical protein